MSDRSHDQLYPEKTSISPPKKTSYRPLLLLLIPLFVFFLLVAAPFFLGGFFGFGGDCGGTYTDFYDREFVADAQVFGSRMFVVGTVSAENGFPYSVNTYGRSDGFLARFNGVAVEEIVTFGGEREEHVTGFEVLIDSSVLIWGNTESSYFNGTEVIMHVDEDQAYDKFFLTRMYQDGSIIWTAFMEPWVQSFEPKILENTVIVVDRDFSDENAILHSLSLINGQSLWQVPVDEGSLWALAVVDNQLVSITSTINSSSERDMHLIYRNASGQEVNRIDIRGSEDELLQSHVVVDDVLWLGGRSESPEFVGEARNGYFIQGYDSTGNLVGQYSAEHERFGPVNRLFVNPEDKLFAFGDYNDDQTDSSVTYEYIEGGSFTYEYLRVFEGNSTLYTTVFSHGYIFPEFLDDGSYFLVYPGDVDMLPDAYMDVLRDESHQNYNGHSDISVAKFAASGALETFFFVDYQQDEVAGSVLFEQFLVVYGSTRNQETSDIQNSGLELHGEQDGFVQFFVIGSTTATFELFGGFGYNETYTIWCD